MRRLRNRNFRVDRLEQDARRNRRKGSFGKWIYLLVLLGLLVWFLNYFLGNLVFFNAEGFVVREEYRVSVPYPARVARLEVDIGDEVAAGDAVARVDSLTIRETIAQLSLAVAELARERSRLEARVAEIAALLPVARRRAERMEGLLAQNTDAYERGLTTATNRSVLIEDEFDAAEKVAQLAAERGEAGRQVALIDRQRAELEARRAVFEQAYDEGIVRAPVDGQVFDIVATLGGVVRAADPILTMVGGAPHILAYVNPGSLAEMPVGSQVRIEYGVREIPGTISRIFSLSKQLPAEFQRQFRPQERSQLIRIDFAEGATPPPTFTKVEVTSTDILPSWVKELLGKEQSAQIRQDTNTKAAKAPPARAAPSPETTAAKADPDRRRQEAANTGESSNPGRSTVVSAANAAPSQPEKPRRATAAEDRESDAAPKDAPDAAPKDAPDAASGPSTAWRVQVASLPDPAAAETALRRVWAAYRPPPGLAYRIVETVAADSTVYRIQLGPFDSADAARAYCSRLKDDGRDCFALAPDS